MSVMRFWIRDEDKTPQRFPLGKLLRCASEELGAPCKIWITRAEGYGESISRYSEVLDEAERLLVDSDEFLVVSAGIQEWFYNLDAVLESPTDRVLLGLHDSTALYVEGADALVKRILGRFEVVSPAS